MFVIRFTQLQLGSILATSFAFAMLPSAGYGYTPEEQQACSGDAFRLCSSDIPDVDRITACMIRNKSQLSPGCRVFFRAGPKPETAPGAAAPDQHQAGGGAKIRRQAAQDQEAPQTGRNLNTLRWPPCCVSLRRGLQNRTRFVHRTSNGCGHAADQNPKR